MATTGVNFIKQTNAVLSGATMGAAAAVVAMNPTSAVQLVNAGYATALDSSASDLSAAGFALNGCGRYALVGTTVKTVDLTNLATGAASSAGDPTFAKVMRLVIFNDGAADATVAAGGSNPFAIGLAGTTPTLTIPTGKTVVLNYATAGTTVDGTHKTIDVTPTAGGSICIAVGGA